MYQSSFRSTVDDKVSLAGETSFSDFNLLADGSLSDGQFSDLKDANNFL